MHRVSVQLPKQLGNIETHCKLGMMSSAEIPLQVIQEILGHNDLGTLQRYLEVTPEQNIVLFR